MKKVIITIVACLLLSGQMTTAQTNVFPSTGSTGIGTTTPDASSLLDIVSTTKGVLVPRMTKAQRDVIASPSTGLLIYQTNNTPGFYYYNGTTWTALKANTASKSLNNLTAPTAVNVELLPGTDNTTNIGSASSSWKDIYLDGALYVAGNKFLAINGTDNIALGAGTLSANTTGFKNTAIGSAALLNNTTGHENTATGTNSLIANTTGNFNTATGTESLFSNTTGIYNTATGASALRFNTIGSGNTATGVTALDNNTTGNNNTAMGLSSMIFNTTGSNNAAFGANSLFSNTSGIYNVATGDSALFSNTVGIRNTAAGAKALRSTTTGSSNVAIGNEAMLQNTTGSFNTAIGASALEVNSGGTGNIAIGHESLDANTTGDYNIAIGEDALGNNITGLYNTACGTGAMRLNATGAYNAAYGEEALYSNTTGNNNVAVGRYALRSSQQNSFNIAIGDSALYSYNHGSSVDHLVALGHAALRNNSTGVYNTSIGSWSLYTNTSGNRNTATGREALYINNGDGNTASGFQSLYSNTTGDDNTATGEYALSNNTTGSDNTAAGTYALLSNTSGNTNTAFGSYALFTNTTGTGNTAIGEGADVSVTNLVNATAIGRSALVSASNCLVLGSVAGVNAATTTIKVGIGTNAPQARLHVRVNNASGVTPLSGTGFILEDNTTTYLSILTPNASQNGIIFGNATSNQGGAIIFNSAANTNGLQLNAGGVTRMAITSAGNVGLGLNNPSFQLQLNTNSAAKPTSSSWTVSSDARLKKDIQDFNEGLEVLKKIHPVWFSYTGEAGMPVNERGAGTLAQELQMVAPYMIKEWTYQNSNGEKQNYLGVDYGAMDFILINSIKEQEQKIEEKDETIKSLQLVVRDLQNDNVALHQEIEKLNSTMKNFDKALLQCCSIYEPDKSEFLNTLKTDYPILEQNSPNPFNEKTMIRCYIPQSASNAMLKIYYLSGEEIKSIPVPAKGINQVEIEASTLSSGTYNYLLIVDGKTIDTRQMILTK